MDQLTILKLRDEAKKQLGEWSWWDQRYRRESRDG
jgi:hypothetical protein